MDWSLDSLADAISGVGKVATTYQNTRAAVSGGGSMQPVSNATVVARPVSGISTTTIALGFAGLIGAVLLFKMARR